MLIQINGETRDVELIHQNGNQVMVRDIRTLRLLFIHRIQYLEAIAKTITEPNKQTALNI